MSCYLVRPDSIHPKYVTPQYVTAQCSKPQYVHPTVPPTEPGGTEQVQRLLQYLTEEALPTGNAKKPKSLDVGSPSALQEPLVAAARCAAEMPLVESADQGPWNFHSPDVGDHRGYLFDNLSDEWGNQAYWSDGFQGDANMLYSSWMGPSMPSSWSMPQTAACQTDHVQEGTSKKNKQPCGTLFKRRCGPLNLASQLLSLEDEDEDTVLLVRKINKLGFGSSDILARHYSAFGSVKKVLLSSSNEKLQRGLRLRPAGIGFVVFKRAEDAQAALAAGECQAVAGISILVQPFTRSAPRKDEGLNVDNSENDSTLSKRSTSDGEGHAGVCPSESGSNA